MQAITQAQITKIIKDFDQGEYLPDWYNMSLRQILEAMYSPGFVIQGNYTEAQLDTIFYSEAA